MDQLAGRTAVVTGGASGIGRAIVDRFVGEGMNVVVADVDDTAVTAAVTDFGQAGHRVLGVRTDVSRLNDIRALAEATLDAFGKINVVVNNAGVVIGGRVEDLTEDEWRWVLDVDLWGAIHGVRVFLPLIEKAGEGHLVSTASTSGMAAPPFIGPYAVSKAGVVALMETVRRELDARASSIGASVLIPGPVNTSLVTSRRNRPPRPQHRSDTPEGRAFAENSHTYLATTGIEPAEVAALVVDAIQRDRFWVLTHPEWADVLRERVESMATTGRLTDRPGP
jgi:NAD(P)-dependent dehydrogenase (short-subunit alcohol dehydrogenase family)